MFQMSRYETRYNSNNNCCRSCNASNGQKWISQGHVSQPCPFFVPISQEVKGADQSTRFMCPATAQTFQRVLSMYRWPSFFVDIDIWGFARCIEVKVKHKSLLLFSPSKIKLGHLRNKTYLLTYVYLLLSN